MGRMRLAQEEKFRLLCGRELIDSEEEARLLVASFKPEFVVRRGFRDVKYERNFRSVSVQNCRLDTG